MNTNNIISTPDITGNIGSCTSQAITDTSKRLNFFKEERINVVTNSCTGQVSEYKIWEFNGGAVFLTFIGSVIALIILGIAFDCWLSRK